MITKGQVLNDTYEIIERMGSGGGGIIYKAYHRRMQKYVAIKLIKDEIKRNLNIRSEVDMLKNLKNDFLPQVIDFVEDGNDVYTVMEFIEGQNFKQLIYGGRKFDEKHVRKYAVQLCRAVKYLHSQNPPIIHSDIKPANVMLTPQDNICLIDFNISMLSNNGIAAAIGGSQGFAAPEQFKRIINTPAYVDDFHEETRFIDNDETEILLDSEISAKQISKIKTKNTAVAYIDTRTDIYGIGATIYYMLTSRTPISGYVDFRGIRCSSSIKDIILKAMNQNPSKRFQSVSEMYKALLNNSYKKSKAPKYIALAFLAAGLCFTAILVLEQLKSNNIIESTVNNNLDIMNYNAQFIYKNALDYCITCNSYGNSIPNGIYCSVLEKKKTDFTYDGTFNDMKNYLNSEIGQDTIQYYCVTIKNGLPDTAFWGTEPLDNIIGSITQDKVIEDNLIIGIYPPYNQADEDLKVKDNITEETTTTVVPESMTENFVEDDMIVMPSLMKKDYPTAIKMLDTIGLQYKVTYSEKKYVDIGENCVYSQKPATGSMVKRDTVVEIGISTYKFETTEQTTTTTTPSTTTPTTTTTPTIYAKPDIGEGTANCIKKLWNETKISKTLYIKTSCYSKTRAVVGAESVKKYKVGTKINVVAATDTGFYKLKDGTFIHSDYVTDENPNSKVQDSYVTESSIDTKPYTSTEAVSEKIDLNGDITIFSTFNSYTIDNFPIEGTTWQDYYWTSDNESCVQFISGTLVTYFEGEATITLTYISDPSIVATTKIRVVS